MKFTDLVNKNKKNFLVYGIGQAFNLVSPIIISPYIISVCGIDSFGKIGLGFSLSLFLILIVDYAFDIKGTQRVAENRDNLVELRKILYNTLYTKGILLIIALIIALLLIYSLPLFYFERKLFLLSFIIVFAQVFNPIWYLQGLEDFKTSSLLNILSKSTYVLLIFFFIVKKDDYIYVNFLLGISSFIFNIIGLSYIIKNKKLKFLNPKIHTVKLTLKNDFSFCISQLFLSLRQLSPLFLTSYFFGYNLAGQYKVVEQIISFFRTLIQVYLKYFFPRLCYLLTFSEAQAISFWKKYRLILLIGVISAVVIIYYFIIDIILYFNISIKQNLSLPNLMKLSLIIPILMVFSLSFEQLMFGFNRNNKYIQITIIVTVINLLLLLILPYYFNLFGVIISIILSEICFIFFYFKSIRNFLNIKFK